MAALAVERWAGGLGERALHNRPVQRSAVTFTSPDRAAALQSVGDDQLVGLLRERAAAAERALDELYARYSGSVYGLARRMLRDESAAEEVLQETFWRLWRYADRYEPGRVRFATWLLRITHNLAVSELRRESHRPRIAEPPTAGTGDDDRNGATNLAGLAEIEDHAPEVAEQVWRAEQRRALVAGLTELPAEQREAVELAYFGGLTHVEIAGRQGAPVSTVKTRLALGLRKLAGILTRERMAPGDVEVEGGDGDD